MTLSIEQKLFGCPFLDPHLTTYHLDIGVQINIVLEFGMSTLTFLLPEGAFIPEPMDLEL